MNFPYNVYIPSLNTINFGTLSINTARKVEVKDNQFVVGRSIDFM